MLVVKQNTKVSAMITDTAGGSSCWQVDGTMKAGRLMGLPGSTLLHFRFSVCWHVMHILTEMADGAMMILTSLKPR